MTVEVTAQTVGQTPTAVVAAATTWAEFPKICQPMPNEVALHTWPITGGAFDVAVF
jgi:hypothetical protein